MGEHPTRSDIHEWDHLPPDKVLGAIVYELYNPVSLLGSHLKRLTDDDDPLTEDDYDEIFDQMQAAVRQLSKTVVQLKRYTQKYNAELLQKEQNAGLS